jgi:hypothetical protein
MGSQEHGVAFTIVKILEKEKRGEKRKEKRSKFLMVIHVDAGESKS